VMGSFKVLRVFPLILLLLVLSSCETKEKALHSLKTFKEEATEMVKAKLSGLPLIHRWIKLPPAPKELYQKTEETMTYLKLSKAKDLYQKEYQEVTKKWEEASIAYKRRYYVKAEKLLKEVSTEAETLLKQVREYEENLKNKALTEYKAKEQELLAKVSSKDEEGALKTRLYLWKLKNLIEMGEYEKFERELKKAPL